MFSRKRADAPNLSRPTPKLLPPSGKYEGNDGKWSTFFINIAGDAAGNGQNFRTLISTSWPVTLIPRQTGWCATPRCSDDRGVMSFEGKPSLGLQTTVSWKEDGLFGLPWPPWWSNDSMLPSTNRSQGEFYGITNIGLGQVSQQSLIYEGQSVVSYNGKDFFLGSLGVGISRLSLAGSDKKNFIKTMAASNGEFAIPSLSYGYTAGAWYRNNYKGVTGNMVFGGYDKSRIVQEKGVQVAMASKQNNTLAVGVRSILYQSNPNIDSSVDSFTSTRPGFSAIIDSTIPYLVLPDDICDSFANKFNLDYDSKSGLYFVNSTVLERNQQQNASISIQIGNGLSDRNTFTNIKLPYGAFDMQVKSPIVTNDTNYFPIRRGGNGPFVLGRTFLQEAYIIVDYERTVFNVTPAAFPEPLPKEDLVAIWNSTGQPVQNDDGGDSGLSAGAIAGIVIGIVAAFSVLGLGAFFYWRRRRNAKAKEKELMQHEKPSEIDTMVAGNEIKDHRLSELDGSEGKSPSTAGGSYYGGDLKKYPAIAEMSPESQPAELYSPPIGSEQGDYFTSAPMPRRRGATRDSANSSPGPIIAELAGDPGQHYEAVSPVQRPRHSRSVSDTSLTTNIDEILSGNNGETPQVQKKGSSRFVEHTGEDKGPAGAEQIVSPLEEAQPTTSDLDQQASTERRPSHNRGLSDTTIQSESTAVSEPTPEELAHWATNRDDAPRRALSQ